MAVPRTCGRRPSQRLRPALPNTMPMWSELPTTPIVARQRGRHAADFAAGQIDLGPIGVAGSQSGPHARRTAQHAAAAGQHLDVVNVHAQRNRRKRQAVAHRPPARPPRS